MAGDDNTNGERLMHLYPKVASLYTPAIAFYTARNGQHIIDMNGEILCLQIVTVFVSC